MSRLNTLLEQTSFLVQKQLEAKVLCGDIFNALLKSIEERIATEQDSAEDMTRLNRVYDMLSGQAQQLMEETQDDLNFLQEQLKALKEISRIEDQGKARELLATIIDPSEELPPTPEFRANIEEEMRLSLENLSAVTNDITQALAEGDLETVEAMLEAMAQGAEDLDIDFTDDEEEDDEAGCCGSSCSSGGCGDCSVGCSSGKQEDGVDIFSSLSKYDQELAQDKKKKN